MKGSLARLKPSTLHQRHYRERLRERGLVKKDVWIRPEYATELAMIEKSMREPEWDAAGAVIPAPGVDMGWTVPAIYRALSQTSAVRGGVLGLEIIEGVEPNLHLIMHDYGDLSLFVAVGGEQIIVEAYLWPLAHVADPAAFNMHVLRTHKLLPLSTISIENVGGVLSYTMFGSLDTRSSLASLMFEIETLADNVISGTEAYADYLLPAEAVA